MPVWAVAPFFGACSAPMKLELHFWAIWFRCFFLQSRLCSVAFVSLPLPSLVCLYCFGVLCAWCVLCLLFFPARLACCCCCPWAVFGTFLLGCFALLLVLRVRLLCSYSCLRLYFGLCTLDSCCRLSVNLGGFVLLPAPGHELAWVSFPARPCPRAPGV